MRDDDSPSEIPPGTLTRLALLIEGGAAVAAVLIAWLFQISLREHLHFSATALVWGVLGTLPPLLAYLAARRSSWEPLKRIDRLLDEVLAPILASARWYELVLLAAMAGICEELLFRGALQPLGERWHPLWGMLLVNLVFGIVHAVTPFYIVWATAMGVYLSVLMDVPGERNLLAPIITHALYNYTLFVLIRRRYQRRSSGAYSVG